MGTKKSMITYLKEDKKKGLIWLLMSITGVAATIGFIVASISNSGDSSVLVFIGFTVAMAILTALAFRNFISGYMWFKKKDINMVKSKENNFKIVERLDENDPTVTPEVEQLRETPMPIQDTSEAEEIKEDIKQETPVVEREVEQENVIPLEVDINEAVVEVKKEYIPTQNGGRVALVPNSLSDLVDICYRSLNADNINISKDSCASLLASLLATKVVVLEESKVGDKENFVHSLSDLFNSSSYLYTYSEGISLADVKDAIEFGCDNINVTTIIYISDFDLSKLDEFFKPIKKLCRFPRLVKDVSLGNVICKIEPNIKFVIFRSEKSYLSNISYPFSSYVSYVELNTDNKKEGEMNPSYIDAQFATLFRFMESAKQQIFLSEQKWVTIDKLVSKFGEGYHFGNEIANRVDGYTSFLLSYGEDNLKATEEVYKTILLGQILSFYPRKRLQEEGQDLLSFLETEVSDDLSSYFKDMLKASDAIYKKQMDVEENIKVEEKEVKVEVDVNQQQEVKEEIKDEKIEVKEEDKKEDLEPAKKKKSSIKKEPKKGK